ncbi:RHS repeat protein [Vibrio sp. Of7-15]|uniref:RHS repeat domain-containing protein n=1 Tax=Vibrio sp. Of7-15 TaxID=2724879 RepID=UPI001EF34650|nr:RHS repeat domain-containing protein [Vibrio sp. Of7-15]MCG7495391.1 RHS repeat protein [Vibrio sp. Of7-15]
MDVVSNAFNFNEFISSGVDIRTGSFSLELSLGTLLANNLSGPNFEKKIVYSPFDKQDYGYGIGWKLHITKFDKSNYNLTLKNGQTFQIEYNSNLKEFTVPYKKLKDTKLYYLSNISKPGETSKPGIKIYYKDGETEFVDWNKGTLERRVSPHGHEIYFTYVAHSGGYRLITVADNEGNTLNTDYWSSNSLTKVSLISLNGEQRTTKLYKMGSELDKVTLPNNESLFTKINYTTLYNLNIRVIDTVTHSTGQVDYIWYKELGHKTPSGSPISHYPYVIKFQSIYDDNQPPKSIEYNYSTLNFLGYNSGISWQAGEDTLFKALSDYTYSCDEIINGSVKISRKYNKYHLINKEKFYSDDYLYQSIQYNYFANLNWTIDHQPENYSLVREQTVTFFSESGSRTETNSYDYDEYGNLLANFHEDGSSTFYEYYPLEGSENKCPTAVNGIVKHLKSEHFYLPNTNTEASPYRSKRIEYKALPMLNNEGEFIVPIKQFNHNNDVSMSYFEEVSDRNLFGRIASKSTTINGFTSQINHQYTFETSLLSIISTLHTHDGLTTLKREDFSYLTGNMVYSHDEQGIEVNVEHDDLDRVTTERWSHHGVTKLSRDYGYSIGSEKNQLEISDSTGRRKVFKFNNANNLISVHQQDNDFNVFKVNEFEYDAYDQVIRQSSLDIVHSKTLPMHEYREYDHWGEVYKIIHPDNTKEFMINDVVAMKSTHYIEGLTSTVKQYNIVGKELSTIRYDSDNIEVSKATNEYNSAHQLVKTVDENGLETVFSYDNSDRLTEKYFYDNEEKITIRIDYASFSNELLATKIMVNNSSMGQRNYDGLGRIVSESKFNNTSLDFEYTGSSAKATKVRTESDNIIEISYDPFWGEKSEVIIDGDENSKLSYQYDAQGRLIKESNSNSDISYQYNNLDQLIAETVDISGSNTPLSASYSYSPMGVLLEQTDFIGMSKSVTYDSLGRIERAEFITKNGSSQNSINISYDVYSRPIEYIYSNSNDTFSNKVYYNSLGIESRQTTHKNGANSADVDLSQHYLNNLKIKERTITIPGKRDTSENMEYDQVGRLTQYRTVGELTPRDHIDQISYQNFHFDIYDNIDSKETNYKSINENVVVDYQYNDQNKTQLSQISQTGENHIISHDISGNLLNDEFGNQYEYDAFNRLISIHDSFGNVINQYQYDARGFLISQRPFNHPPIYLYYQHNSIANEYSPDHSTSYIGVDNKLIGRVIDEQHNQYMATDTNGSVLSTWTRSQNQITQSLNTYTPFGSSHKQEFSS